MIRAATVDDIPRLAEMGRKFHAAAQMGFGFDLDAVSGLLGRMIEAPEAVVLTSGGGGIGGVLTPAYCDPKWIQAVELFWWAEDRQGLRLLREFEAWAEAKGANEIRMTTLSTIPESARLMRGYAPAEVSYSRIT